VKPEDEEHPEFAKYAKHAHAGPVLLLARSPFFADVLLSVGDWSFRLWRIGTREPIFISEFGSERYTSGARAAPTPICMGMYTCRIRMRTVYSPLQRCSSAVIR
jgi:hypothetical protein